MFPELRAVGGQRRWSRSRVWWRSKKFTSQSPALKAATAAGYGRSFNSLTDKNTVLLRSNLGSMT